MTDWQPIETAPNWGCEHEPLYGRSVKPAAGDPGICKKCAVFGVFDGSRFVVNQEGVDFHPIMPPLTHMQESE